MQFPFNQWPTKWNYVAIFKFEMIRNGLKNAHSSVKILQLIVKTEGPPRTRILTEKWEMGTEAGLARVGGGGVCGIRNAGDCPDQKRMIV